MIRIRFFAVVRERLGTDELQLQLGSLGEATVAGALDAATKEFPQLEQLLPHVRIALDHDFVEDHSTPIASDSEIALIPPVSGGAGTEVASRDRAFLVTQKTLRVEEVVGHVRRASAGAVITFEGTVRDHTDEHAVDYLEYEAYPQMALKKLIEVADRAAEQWPAVIAVHHRWGRLELGETAVVIAVSTPHRKDGYECSQWIIDRLKEEVPIWKKEVGPDGEEWIGFGP